jgi:hypothetical protein
MRRPPQTALLSDRPAGRRGDLLPADRFSDNAVTAEFYARLDKLDARGTPGSCSGSASATSRPTDFRTALDRLAMPWPPRPDVSGASACPTRATGEFNSGDDRVR